MVEQVIERLELGFHETAFAEAVAGDLATPGVTPLAAVDRERSSVYVAGVDVPAFFAGFRIASADELGHAPLKRCLRQRAIAQGMGYDAAAAYQIPATRNFCCIG
jgi:hypothetical protein